VFSERYRRGTRKRDRSGGRSFPKATLRVGGALPITEVLTELGVEPTEVLREAGIDPGLFADPDNLITYRARGRLMACCVARTGCRHFGLLVGKRMNLQSLGLVGMLVRNSRDVRTALRSVVTFLHLHTSGAVMRLKISNDMAMLTYDTSEPNVEATDQTGDAAVAMILNVMRTFCGPDFVPIEAWFRHRKPENVQPFRRFFRAPLRFDAQENGLVFSRRWLDVRLTGTDEELRRLLQKQVNALEAKHRDDFPEQVRGVLRSALLAGHASADQTAKLFALHSRTLSRRLEAFGTSYREILDECRFGIALQMLGHMSLDVGEIAASLGYARASAFTRAFRRWSGTTPKIWRAKRHKTS
jgi:AraC-like DNA-binding protein